jgi:hypothetical protein
LSSGRGRRRRAGESAEEDAMQSLVLYKAPQSAPRFVRARRTQKPSTAALLTEKYPDLKIS